MSKQSLTRVIGVILAHLLILYWLWFAFTSLPWIVPADHDSSLVRVYERASKGGLIMVAVSVASGCFVAGILGTGRWAWLTAAALFASLVYSLRLVYPSIPYDNLSEFRLPAHAGGILIIAAGIVTANCSQRNPSTNVD
jgi:hypothetical protein